MVQIVVLSNKPASSAIASSLGDPSMPVHFAETMKVPSSSQCSAVANTNKIVYDDYTQQTTECDKNSQNGTSTFAISHY